MYVEVLKQCLKSDLMTVKQVLECIINRGMHHNIYVANNLLIAYIICGRLEYACQMFDELMKKDVFSWTNMIGGYAQHNCAKNAMEVFNRMCQEGVQPDAIT